MLPLLILLFAVSGCAALIYKIVWFQLLQLGTARMYVQYQTPVSGAQHVPVVMVHGCCLSSKTWETTPDGRMGWNEYFVRKNRSVYLADQASRALSGFDPTTINAVKSGSIPPAQLPNVLMASHQVAWSVFRFGPSFNKPFPDGQFPVEAVDELYKQMIPDLNSTLPSPNPTTTSFDGCQKFVQQLKDAGGDAEMMHLPKLGIRGNSHMLMQDRNNLQLADLILNWIDGHVEGKKAKD